MVQLIKKGGLRERANRSRTYQGSENTATTLQRHGYRQDKVATKSADVIAQPQTNTDENDCEISHSENCVIPQPDGKNQE